MRPRSLSDFSFGHHLLASGVSGAWLEPSARGRGTVVLTVPGGPFELSGLSSRQTGRLRAGFAGRCASIGLADTEEPARVAVYRAAPELFRPDEEVGGLVEIALQVSGDVLRLVGQDFLGEMGCREPRRGYLFTFDRTRDAFLSQLSNFIRPVVGIRLVRSDGLLLHSGAAVVDGEGYVFFGHSGSGKSTSSRLSLEAGLRILSDDLNVLTLEDGRLMVEAFPQAGELRDRSTPGRYPVKGLYRLRHGPEHAVGELSMATGAATLASCAPFVNNALELEDALLGTVGRIARAVPVRELTFRKDPGFWELLLRD